MATQAVSGALLFAFLQVSIERLASTEVKNFFSGKDSIVKRLKELSTALTSAGKVLDDTEGKRIIDQTVNKQLDDLKEAVYDADDLVYKIHTEASQNQREGESPKRFLQVRRFINPNTFEKEIKLEIDEILRKLKIAEKEELVKRLSAASLVEESNVYGRDPDKEDIIRKYYSLPSHLKSCFAYCALFPKDYKFVKEKVILLWMAEGLLHTKNEKRMEEVGEEYIQYLISRSFFQPSDEDESAFVRRDLATSVLGEFSLQMDDINFYNCAHKIRHLSFSTGADDPKKFEALSKAKGLRTFLRISELNTGERWSLKEQLLETLLHTWGCLRVLSVSRLDIIKLPDSIGDLKYLRYLDLSHTEIEEVPEIVCNLYNLQTLLLDGCLRLTRLPTNIGNLINLRHLHTPPNLKEMPEQLCKLTNLQTLSEFVVSKKKECGVKLLDDLKGLRGTLHISRLENVADVDEVSKAKLKKKEFLSKLILEWGSSHASNEKLKESEVLEALEPDTNLKEIDIRNYLEISFPNWVGGPSFSNVVKVRLIDCKKCSSLPPLGQLPFLKHLIIRGFHGVETIDSKFYSTDSSAAGTKPFIYLEILRFLDMPNLQKWLFLEDKAEDGIFPCLKELELRDCPKLKVSLPNSLPSLRKLVVDDCAQLEPLRPGHKTTNDAFNSLETLSISRCDGQKSLLEGGLPKSLKQICIVQCWELEFLDEETFKCLTSLEKLQISFCDKLERLPGVLPPSLSYLSIESCNSLTPKLQRETGEDWPKIAHISTLDIRSHPLFK